ncbi:histidinol-phosphate transaminase [Halobacteriales archaeon QS_1_68_20]|nr:MAG: histidinol-phosphate transaminase [Halobacteriales archaeon QS_1_68_20]
MEPRDLSGHVAYQAGRGDEEVARELGIDPDDLVTLSSNENPLGPSPAAIEAIRGAASSVHQYPKAAHVDLRDELAERWDLDPRQVWLAAGGDGAIDYLSRATLDPGDGVLVPAPGFAYYGMSARYHHGTAAEYALAETDDFELAADVVLSAYDGERVVYVTSPHNPTGAEMTVDGVRLVAEETDQRTLVVVDEAYGEFSDRPSAATLLDERDDVAVLRTFSKVYGLAGVRLGYALVPDEWADAYAKVNTPFAASELACRAGLAALDDDAHVEESVHVARWAREFMRDAISAPTYESGGNFVLVDVGDADVSQDPDDAGAAAAVARELRERGVIVRDCTSFGLPEHVRITCGTEHETRGAVETVNEVVGS